MNSIIGPKGYIEGIIEYKSGDVEKIEFNNAVVNKGREALAKSLANDIGDDFEFFINKMLFGDAGTNSGVPKFVSADRNGLFGVTRANKAVIATVDSLLPSQVVFTTVLTFDDANGFTLNEMALQMSNGDLYSMATFADLNKTSSMQITWNWRLSFV